MLTTLENVRQYLAKDDSETKDDDLLFELVKSVSKKINNKLNRTLEATDYVEYYQGDGTNRLLLRQYPVNSVTSIYDDVDRQWGSNTAKDPTSIVIAMQTPGLIQLKSDIFINSAIWSYYNLENLNITYNAGYVLPTDANPNSYQVLPDDIIQAANKLVAVEYIKSKGMMAGIKLDRDPKALDAEAWEDLMQYARIR